MFPTNSSTHDLFFKSCTVSVWEIFKARHQFLFEVKQNFIKICNFWSHSIIMMGRGRQEREERERQRIGQEGRILIDQ